MTRSRPSPSLRISTARKAVALHLDVKLLDGRHRYMPAVRLAPQHGREQPHHCRPSDRRSLVIPGAIARDAHPRIAAALRVPLVDRRKPALRDQPLQLGEADAVKIDRWPALGHLAVIGLLRSVAQGRSAASCRLKNRNRYGSRQTRRPGDHVSAARGWLERGRPRSSRRGRRAGGCDQGGRGPRRRRMRRGHLRRGR